MQTADYKFLKYLLCYFYYGVLTVQLYTGLFRLIAVNLCTPVGSLCFTLTELITKMTHSVQCTA